MEEKKIKQFVAVMYVRLSREDNKVDESNSIVNQKNMIYEFVSKQTDLTISLEAVDAGYSGVDFNRPAFMRMIELIKERKINCVIVKDLSRFGRNYIEVGKYLERVFPFYEVRFIAINDGYDSYLKANFIDSIMLPFQNLMNEAYSRDISLKTQSHLEVKRKNGEFLGAFASFGYRKAKENKNHLIVDVNAACVVKDIYRWKLKGLSPIRIANKLNEMGVLSPMEYKKSMGYNFVTGTKKDNVLWSAKAIERILKNEIYIGNMIQGKEYIPIFKKRKKKLKPKEEWIRVANTHQAIIEEEMFYNVQRLFAIDTRVAPKKEALYEFGGFLVCGYCGQTMIHKKVPSKKKVYIYYICSTKKHTNKCFNHAISENLLNDAIDKIRRLYIQLILDERLVGNTVYSSDNRICNSEGSRINKNKNNQIKELVNEVIKDRNEDSKYELRNFLVEFIDKIYIYDCSRIEIRFRCHDYNS